MANSIRNYITSRMSADSYRKYTLFLLFCALTLNFVDRQIMAILQESIKKDLDLTDTQLGLLVGIAFSLFYTTLGIPLALLADKWSRTKVITITIALWSLMTAMCGLATNYGWLFLARMGVGVGEAGGSPPSHSLISDLYAPKERATALGLYALGIPVGSVLAFAVGGVVNEYCGWRTALMIVGMPGLLLALLIHLTMQEPAKGQSEGRAHTSPEMRTTFRETARLLWRQRSFCHLAVASGLHSFVGVGVVIWLPSFLMRVYHLSSVKTGIILAVAIGIFGTLGSSLGGIAGDCAGRRSKKWYLWLPGIALFTAAPLTVIVYTAPNLYMACTLMAVIIFLGNFHIGSTFATAQGLAPIYARSQAAAVLMFVNSILALGVGPLATGVASDLLFKSYGTPALGYAIIIVSVIACLWGVYHYLMAARTVEDDLVRGQSTGVSESRTGDAVSITV